MFRSAVNIIFAIIGKRVLRSGTKMCIRPSLDKGYSWSSKQRHCWLDHTSIPSQQQLLIRTSFSLIPPTWEHYELWTRAGHLTVNPLALKRTTPISQQVMKIRSAGSKNLGIRSLLGWVGIAQGGMFKNKHVSSAVRVRVNIVVIYSALLFSEILECWPTENPIGHCS